MAHGLCEYNIVSNTVGLLCCGNTCIETDKPQFAPRSAKGQNQKRRPKRSGVFENKTGVD